MKLPAIWRKRRGKSGPYYGNRLATVDGQDINLGTKDPDEAREVLRSILAGKAAEASEPDVEGGAADTTTVAANQSPGQIPTAAAAPPSSPVVVPELVDAGAGVNPGASNDNARAEADATNAAAADTGGAGDAGPSSPAAAAGFTLPPEAIEGLLQQGGKALVLVQLKLQRWIVKETTGKIAPTFDLEEPTAKMLIDAAAQGWVAQLKVWFPDIEMCPPWLVAVGAPALFLPAQFAGAQAPPPKKPAEDLGAAPIQAAA